MNTIGARNITDIFGDSAYIVFLSSDLVFSGNNPPHSGYRRMTFLIRSVLQEKPLLTLRMRYEDVKGTCIVRLGLPIGDSVTGTKGAKDFVHIA